VSSRADVDEIDALASNLRAVLLRLARHLRSEAHSSGVTGAQIAILVALEFNPGITAQRLAVREGLSGPGVSGHLARLEGMGLLRRERGDDRHSVGLFLTSAGRALVDDVRHQRTAWLSDRLAGLSTENREKIRDALPALDEVSMGDR
jgi:DNA-binding MarR family transcriptional regulator